MGFSAWKVWKANGTGPLVWPGGFIPIRRNFNGSNDDLKSFKLLYSDMPRHLSEMGIGKGVTKAKTHGLNMAGAGCKAPCVIQVQ